MKSFLLLVLLTLTLTLTNLPILGQNPDEMGVEESGSEAYRTLEKNISSLILSLTPNPPITPPNTIILMVEEAEGGSGEAEGGEQTDSIIDANQAINPDTRSLPLPTAKDISESGAILATPISIPQAMQILAILEDAGLLGQAKKYYGEAQERTQELPVPPQNAQSIVTSLDQTPKRGVKLGLTITQKPWFIYYEINSLNFEEAKTLLKILSENIDPNSARGLQEMLSKIESFKH